MVKKNEDYNVATHYNPSPNLASIERGYTILIKIAIRMIEEKRIVTNKIKMTDV